MKKPHLVGVLCIAVFGAISFSANAALLGRLPITPGGTDFQAAYDTVLDITWTTNASLSGSNNWATQVAWASGLDYLGFDDWRLASMSLTAGLPNGVATSVVNCSSVAELACRDNELGYMFFHNLGGSVSDSFWGNVTIGDVTLTGVQQVYWSGTASDPQNAWIFYFNGGDQFDVVTWYDRYGWAVRSGDVSTVPVPGAVWLFGSGLIGLLRIARCKR